MFKKWKLKREIDNQQKNYRIEQLARVRLLSKMIDQDAIKNMQVSTNIFPTGGIEIYSGYESLVCVMHSEQNQDLIQMLSKSLEKRKQDKLNIFTQDLMDKQASEQRSKEDDKRNASNGRKRAGSNRGRIQRTNAGRTRRTAKAK